ncbi:hypothetical protein [Endozoicomonas sp. GU-1]|uniref:hypothetical protein n=1 Tax=Endozoicomonas sp. GU-1 TaxID=3009078 RepID=UPI0022B4323E|nr:hypothetical protein [Endozoicomonas sp. GU-1]WBA82241.1 hypothetical protein O2T12_03520 [Endozoicomonas sp. GU-1]WBA85178.1 hypothetical protein O3276_18210 [Endozoicomonas sp. GU-1]
MAIYAETHAEYYRRIDAIAKVGEKLRLLDLTDKKVRETVAVASDAKSLYEGAWYRLFRRHERLSEKAAIPDES